MDGKIEVAKVRESIYELKRWKRNRDNKTLERGANRPLTSGALDTAIYYLERYEKLLVWFMKKSKK